MNVVYYSSDFFSEMCGVSIESLCENNRECDAISFYIVEDNISQLNKDRLTRITDKFDRRIVFIPMPTQEEVYPGIKINLGRTYARMALGEILPPDVERVLSLDSDTLVMDNIEKMYNTEFDTEEYVAGVYDCLGSAMQNKVLKAPKDMKYCNAGMFLIDLKKWRKRNVGNELLEAVFKNVKNNKTMYFLEQDLMNTVFYENLKLLGPRYNLLTSIYLFDYEDVIRMKKPVIYYSKEEVEQAKRNPAILHATTCFYVKRRMWVVNSDHPYFDFYKKYRENTDWKNEPFICDSRTIRKKVYAFMWHIIPQRFAIFLATILINNIRPYYAEVTSKLSITTVAEQSST